LFYSGADRITFVAVEAGGEAEFLDPLRKELVEWTAAEYTRFTDDLVILVDSQPGRQQLRRRWRRGYGRSWPNRRRR
jgi:hypothetical protein